MPRGPSLHRLCLGLPRLSLLGLGLAGLLLLSSGSVRAQVDPAAGEDACQTDIHRLCDRFFPDPALVATCLVDRRRELSQACAETLARPRDP